MPHANHSQGGGEAHDHDHGPASKDHDDRLTYYRAMEIALREILIGKGIFTADDVRRAVEAMDSRTPENGARLVARAWTDPAFKTRLLTNGKSAAAELGIKVGEAQLVVIENRSNLHNLVCCTLCSCYPRSILGQPPSWYISKAYRARAVREPRAVLAEFGLTLPDDVELRVHDSNADMRYLVLPERPAGTEGMSEVELATLVTRDSMIGVAKASSVPVASVS